jgi:hypothetical protein
MYVTIPNENGTFFPFTPLVTSAPNPPKLV